MTLGSFPPLSRKQIALRALGMLASDDLPDLAAHLLDVAPSASMAALAGAIRADDPRERADLFARGLDELGLGLPSRLDAAAYLVRQFAQEAASGELSSRVAAESIRDVYHSVELELPPERFVGSALGVEHVIGLYYSLDDALSSVEHADVERTLVDALIALAGQTTER